MSIIIILISLSLPICFSNLAVFEPFPSDWDKGSAPSVLHSGAIRFRIMGLLSQLYCEDVKD